MDARFELETPPGPGGITVVSVSGPDRLAAAEALLRRPDGTPAGLRPGGPRRLDLHVGGELLDAALVVVRPDAVELHLHGSPAVLVALAASTGLVEPAVSAAERLLRGAASEAQLALALEQREVDWERYLREVDRLPPRARERELVAARQRSRVAMALATPLRLVLCGAQNAGKSTLLNRLVLAERALTGALAGTTRDPVVETTTLDGYPYVLVDTAGDGEAPSALDREAQRMARRVRRCAALVLVVDGSADPTAVDRRLAASALLVVRTKTDLPPAPWNGELGPLVEVSCLDARDAARVRQRLGARLRRARGLPAAGPAGGVAALDAGQWRILLRRSPG